MNDIEKTISLILHWLADNTKKLEGNDDIWSFYQMLSDDLYKLQKMIKEKDRRK